MQQLLLWWIMMMMMMSGVATVVATAAAAVGSSHHQDTTAFLENAETSPSDALQVRLSAKFSDISTEPLRRMQQVSSWLRTAESKSYVDWTTTRLHGPNRTVSVDYGGRHPFDQQQQQQKGGDPEHRQAFSIFGGNGDGSSGGGVYKPIRIHFITDPIESHLGEGTDSDYKIDYIINTVLPTVADKWSSHLQVVPTVGKIEIDSSVCYGLFSNQISSTVLQDGGISNADLVIVASFDDSLTDDTGALVDFCNTGTLAVATSCLSDGYDRPIIGFINFCPPTSSPTSSRLLEEDEEVALPFDKQVSYINKQDLTQVAIHEVGHVLGFSINSFPYFRDPITGSPLTPRNSDGTISKQTVECTNDRGFKEMVFPSSAIVQQGTTTNGLLYYDIVTPRVQSVARNHFNCQSLAGGRLENQDTAATSCVGSHWDERLFYSELMSPIYSSTADILSPLTLALLEDSGWYQVDYSNSSLSPFGQGAGCDFVNGPCIVNDEVPSYGRDYFCANPTVIDSNGKIDTLYSNFLCDPNHYEMALCLLFDVSQLPSNFLNSDTNLTDAVRYFTDTNLVGPFPQGDYCPMPILPTQVDCTDPNNTGYVDSIYDGEQYGLNSRCVNSYFLDSSGVRRAVPGCFSFQCDAVNFRVVINGATCDYDGQLLGITTFNGLSATMICPPITTICPDLGCLDDCSGRGVCDYNGTGPPVCQCTDTNVTAANCQNGTAPVPVPLNRLPRGQRSSAVSLSELGRCLSTLLMLLLGTVVATGGLGM